MTACSSEPCSARVCWCSLDEAAVQVDAGDRQSPSWTPFRGTDGTPNESVNDVLVRATGLERAVQDVATMS